MRDHPQHADATPPRSTGDPLPIAALLRARADGETLSADDSRRLDEHLAQHPEHSACLAFERSLRSAVARTLTPELSAGPVPAHLRSRVQNALRAAAAAAADTAADSAADQPSAERPVRAGAVEGVPARGNGRRLGPAGSDGFFIRRWFGPGLRLAALVAVAVGIGFGLRSMLPGAGPGAPADSAALAAFVEGEHLRCIDADAFSRKALVTSLAEVPAKFQSLLGRPIWIADLEAIELEFQGAGQCAVPGDGASVHLLFRPRSSAGEHDAAPHDPADEDPLHCPTRGTISLFVQTDTGALGLREGETYRLTECEKGAAVVWVRDGLIYYLVTGDGRVCDTVRERMSLPEPHGSL